MPDLTQAVRELQKFCGVDLTSALSVIESSVQGVTAEGSTASLAGFGAHPGVLAAAGLIKRLSGQNNVAVHALGVLLCLPHLLEPGEGMEQVSWGAGNTGHPSDLETNRRIAEFRFIKWRGGPESIRQNSIFKDFYWREAYSTAKQKFLYLLSAEHPLRFLDEGRCPAC